MVLATEYRPNLTSEEREAVLTSVRHELQENDDFDHNTMMRPSPEDREAAREIIAHHVATATRNRIEAAAIAVDFSDDIQRILDDVIGFGRLQPLMDDDDIEEIWVNSPLRVFVKRRGEVEFVDIEFDETNLINIIDRMLAPTGRHVDIANPITDAQLPDGSRVNVVIPPAAQYPSITIRKFLLQDLTFDDLVKRGTLSEEAAAFLRAAVKARLSLLIAGATGTGKTTALNALATLCNDINERLVTIEETPELQVAQMVINCVPLVARQKNAEGFGEITIRDLVKTSLRQTPTRIIVGEIRGPEAHDMLTAMSTGHEGSMCTLHSSNARGALTRIETCGMQGDKELSESAIRMMIAEAIQLVVYLRQDPETRHRYVDEIIEVTGLERDDAGELVISSHALFRTDPGDPEHQLVYTGLVSRNADRLARYSKGDEPWLGGTAS